MSEATQGNAPEGIRAFDSEGREVLVPREQWQNEVLPGMLQQAWDQPDQLYMLIVNSLNDGFLAEVGDASRHLYEIDPMPARGTCMWAVVLIQTGRLVEAEMVLTGFNERHGEDASVLINLARVYAAKGEQARAEATLDRALTLEPNHENGLGWWAAMAQERGGDAAAAQALEQMRTNPASWRAQLWLARTELEGGRLENARALYEEALARAPQPVPPDFLMQMSGDLGGLGHLRELLEFTAPHFVPEVHGLPVGNNLIKASVDTGNLDAAASIVGALTQFNRPDWRDPLAFWEQEIAKFRAGTPSSAPPGAQQIQIGMLRVDGPVWLPPGSPARAIFGAKPTTAACVTFLGGTAEAPEASSAEPTPEQLETADHLGRLTRSLPLFLAEQTDLRTSATGRAMLPWAVAPAAGPGGHPGGFVVAAAQWPDATAVQTVQDPANRSDYVVTVHIDAEVEPWEASLVFLRSSDGVRIGELSAEFEPDEFEPALEDLADEVVELLSALGQPSEAPHYQLPDNFPAYLGQLEQLLALRCVTVDGGQGQPLAQSLAAERPLLESTFALEEEAPDNVAVRLLLLETVSAMQRNRPEMAAEYSPRLEQVLQNHPLAPVDAVFART